MLLLTYFTLVGVVSSDFTRSTCTTSFTPCCSIFCQSYVFFQGCPCPLLDGTDVLHPGTAFLFSPAPFRQCIHVFTRVHLLFLHACPKKTIFLSIIWERSSKSVLFEFHRVCSCLHFSPSNLSAAFFGSTTFLMIIIFFHH